MKRVRQQKIIELITHQDIDTQEGILKGLRENGLCVTQATVSRDIKELQLVKTLSASGSYRYTVSPKADAKEDHQKYDAILSESLVHAEAAMNMVVVKCHVGMAQAACACLDRKTLDGVVGTLAGDDTVFVVMKTTEDAEQLAKQLLGYIQ